MMQENTPEQDDKAKELANAKPTISLNEPGLLPKLATRIAQDLDRHCVTIYDEGFRWHLGASIIGDECKRKLWYSFRWVAKKTDDGRMYRLFNRGHLEEPRHAEWLRGMGFTVWTHDESQTKPDGTHPQLRIANRVRGHFGGSLDGIVAFPERYNIEGYALLSSKTSGTGAGFNSVRDKSLVLAKPEHYTQESVYGYAYGIEHVLYMCANKNDDDLAIKVEKLDFALAKNMEVKAESIIFSQTPPQRMSENPTHFKCKSLCEFKDICHYGKPAVKNCRSCVNCSPVDNAEFYCSKWDGIIPRSEVPNGCAEWISITEATKEVEPASTTFAAIAPDAYKVVNNVGMFEIESVPLPK